MTCRPPFGLGTFAKITRYATSHRVGVRHVAIPNPSTYPVRSRSHGSRRLAPNPHIRIRFGGVIRIPIRNTVLDSVRLRKLRDMPLVNGSLVHHVATPRSLPRNLHASRSDDSDGSDHNGPIPKGGSDPQRVEIRVRWLTGKWLVEKSEPFASSNLYERIRR